MALTEAGAGSSRYREAQVGNHERGCGFPSPPFLPSCLRGGRAAGSKEVRKRAAARGYTHDGSVLIAEAEGGGIGRTGGGLRRWLRAITQYFLLLSVFRLRDDETDPVTQQGVCPFQVIQCRQTS